MIKLNKTCVICGNKYSYCPSCGADHNKPSWMASFCSENCKNIYDVVARYGMKKINVDEAIEILNTCDLSSKPRFTTSTQRLIDELYESPKEVCDEQSECSVVESDDAYSSNCEQKVINILENEITTTEPQNANDSVAVVHKINYKKKKKNR